MSFVLVGRFVEQTRSQPLARLVGIIMASATPDDGICWLPQDELSRRTGMHERSVRRCVRQLEELGELETRHAQRGNKHINVYRLWCGEPPDYTRLPFEVDHPFSTTGQPVRRSEVARPPDTDGRTTGQADRSTLLTSTEKKESERERAASTEVEPAGANGAITAQTVMAEIVDACRADDIPLSSRHRGILARQVDDLLKSGFDRTAVILAAVLSVRRGQPQNAHFIAGDIVAANAGKRLSRREYEKALEDETELANVRRRS